jgi:hypothetical protein
MSWVTIIWSMIASACLTLAAVYLLVWSKKRTAWANLLFSLTAVATAALACCEFWMMRAAGAVGMRVEEDNTKGSTAVLFFRRDAVPADIVEKSAEIRRLLKLPADAFAAVHHRGHWFWIDDGDWQTKRALTAVMFFFTLAETGDSGKLPLITIPAQ